MGERVLRKHEVVGSNPSISTKRFVFDCVSCKKIESDLFRSNIKLEKFLKIVNRKLSKIHVTMMSCNMYKTLFAMYDFRKKCT